jgi:hypothetical protein
MADVDISVQKLTKSGLNATYTDDSTLNGTDTFLFENGNATFMYVKNGDGSSHTVTVQTPATVSGLDVAELTIDVPAGEDRFIGPFPPGVFNYNTGKAKFTLDAGTSMEIAILRT